MLTDHLKLLPLNEEGQPVDADGNVIPIEDWGVDVGLIEAFLNPVRFDQDGAISAEQAAGAIFRSMTYVHGNEIDEFVVESLRNNLLGLPLDLPAINIARGRDAGVPTLNDAREQLYAASNSSWLKPYATRAGQTSAQISRRRRRSSTSSLHMALIRCWRPRPRWSRSATWQCSCSA